jgi:predicted nuclease of restriction endonuclease-like RecB superfamily
MEGDKMRLKKAWEIALAISNKERVYSVTFTNQMVKQLYQTVNS